MQLQSTQPNLTRRPILRVTAALTLLGAAVIHVGQIGIHVNEWAAAGAFFIALALGQGLLGIALLIRRVRPLSIAAVVISLGAIAAWAISRTTGIPFGPEAGVAEPIGRSDSLATLLEAVTILTLLPLLRLRARHESAGPVRGRGYFAVTLVSVFIAALTTFAIQPAGGCGHHGQDAQTVAHEGTHREEADGLHRHEEGHDDDESSLAQEERSHDAGSGETSTSEKAEEC